MTSSPENKITRSDLIKSAVNVGALGMASAMAASVLWPSWIAKAQASTPPIVSSGGT